jgi:hypothetical protein
MGKRSAAQQETNENRDYAAGRTHELDRNAGHGQLNERFLADVRNTTSKQLSAVLAMYGGSHKGATDLPMPGLILVGPDGYELVRGGYGDRRGGWHRVPDYSLEWLQGRHPGRHPDGMGAMKELYPGHNGRRVFPDTRFSDNRSIYPVNPPNAYRDDPYRDGRGEREGRGDRPPQTRTGGQDHPLDDAVKNQVRKNMVRLENNGSEESGVIVNMDDGTRKILTDAHGLPGKRPGDYVKFTDSQGKPHQGRIASLSPNGDVAAIELPPEMATDKTLGLDLSTQGVRAGHTVYAAGFPGGSYTLGFTSGRAGESIASRDAHIQGSSLDPYARLQRMDAFLAHGMSGGLAFTIDPDGRVKVQGLNEATANRSTFYSEQVHARVTGSHYSIFTPIATIQKYLGFGVNRRLGDYHGNYVARLV